MRRADERWLDPLPPPWRRRRDNGSLGCLIVPAIIVGFCWWQACGPTSCDAQDDVALAQVCVHEAGWRHGADCAAFMEVIQRVQRARRHRTFTEAAHLYAGNVFTATSPHNAWAADLAADAHRPAGWPAQLPWDRGIHAYRPRWLSLLRYAWSLLHGKDWVPCGVLAEHWAACTHPTRFVRLECGRTVDCFYTRRTT